MLFEALIGVATPKLKASGFEQLDENGGQRHGAWEWTWVRRREQVGFCYASLGAIGPIGDTYQLEVWAGADNGRRFGRYLVREFHNVQEDDLPSQLQELILGTLIEAAKRASALPDTALTDRYVSGTTPA